MLYVGLLFLCRLAHKTHRLHQAPLILFFLQGRGVRQYWRVEGLRGRRRATFVQVHVETGIFERRSLLK